MRSALIQIGALIRGLLDDFVITREDQILLERYLVCRGHDVPWPDGETERIRERILKYHTQRILEKRDISVLPQWSQEKLAGIQIILMGVIEKKRKLLLFFIALEVQWSYYTLSGIKPSEDDSKKTLH